MAISLGLYPIFRQTHMLLYVICINLSPVTCPFCLEWEIPSQPLQDNLPGPAGRQVVARWCPPNDHVGLEKPLSIWLYVP